MKQAHAHNLIAIQILRSIAALSVVVWHSDLAIKLFTHDYWPDRDAHFRAAYYPFWANHLAAGVDIFFCISGFIMAMLAARALNARDFIIHRFARILPPYWFFTSIVVCVYMIAPHYNVGELTVDWVYNFTRIIKSLLLIPQPQHEILLVGWTLVHEFLFYYLIAVLILFKQGKNVIGFLTLAAVISIVLCLGHITLLYGYGLSPFYIEFLCGALAYRYGTRICAVYPHLQCAAAILLYAITSALLDYYQDIPASMLIQMSGFGLMGSLLITGLMGLDARYRLVGFYIPKLLARIGNASYSLYLSHWFVLSAIGKCAVYIQDAPVIFIVVWHMAAIVAAVVFAVLFAEYVELPFHRVLLNYLQQRKERAMAV